MPAKRFLVLMLGVIICTFSSIGCYYIVTGTEQIEAEIVSVDDIKGYPLMSDKQYSADVKLKYEYNGIKHEESVEMDERSAKDSGTTMIYVSKKSGAVIESGIIATPFAAVILGMLFIGGSGVIVEIVSEEKENKTQKEESESL